jgi:glycerol uptake facilitator protein
MTQSPILGEFAGTFTMMLLGDGVVAAVILKKTKAEGAGWLAITTGWAFAVLCGIFVSTLFGSPAAYLNPALTIAVAVKGGEAAANVLPFILAEIAGAFVAAIFVWLFYLPHWKETEDQATKLAVFCTGPAIRSYGSNLLSEIIASFMLMLIIGAAGSKLVFVNGAAAGFGPFLVGCIVWSIGLSLGATTGYAINPARDFGPRLAHALLPIAGKGPSDWSYAWVPILGPILGTTLAALVLRAIGA